jgi:superfamily II DNA/RNA helicase
MTFAEVGVPADLAASLEQRGILHPFAIQAATIPDAIAGRDVSGKAPTGSGKTLAFGLPLVARVGKATPRRPRALILVPTRELAAQVARELTPLAATRGRSVAAFYGGAGLGPQRTRLRAGCDIVVACPGRLEDLLGTGDASLADVDLVVIDEADRMADMGFLPAVTRLLDQVRSDRQTLLFSATLDGDVDVLVRRYQRNPVRHEVEVPAEQAGRVDHR